jgi:RimJ/RimL family protein N-acetyltransferase
MRLSDLPGLGPKSEEMLERAGIRTVADLETLGPVEAFLRVCDVSGAEPSLNLLYALAGAVDNRHWADIARRERDRLLFELEGQRNLRRMPGPGDGRQAVPRSRDAATVTGSGFDFQPTLRGPRVIVRPVRPSDREPMFAAAADPDIWAQHPATDRHTEPVFRQYFDAALACGSAFAFVDRKSGAIIGSSRYHGFDAARREVEIGWTFLARAYWGGSYNAEIKTLMLEHAFRYVDKVLFWVGETNYRSRRAMEKIGGILRPGVHYRPLSGAAPYVVYEIVAADRARAGEPAAAGLGGDVATDT